MKKTRLFFASNILALFAMLVVTTALNGASMTNTDVIKMVKAGIDESVIITSIQNAENGFDTSVDGLIALSSAQVPKPVVNAMIARGSPASTAANTTAPANSATPATGVSNANPQSEDEIIMIDKGARTTLKYVKPQRRAASRGGIWAGGIAGVASYCVLPNPKASLRVTPNATFIVSVPENASIENYLVLANFEPRKNGTREVLTGGGTGINMSTGIPKVRVVALTVEKAADQSRAPAQHIIYAVKPAQPLKKGEYAFVGSDKCFDFGVD